MWFTENQMIDHPTAFSFLADINRVILKTISSMFYFVDVAPNVLAYDLDVMVALLSINLQVNNTIGQLEDHDYDHKKYDLVVFQMINLIERFTISNCPLRNLVVENQKQNRTIELTAKIGRSVEEFNELLENTGLSIANFSIYNISNDWTDHTRPLEPHDKLFNEHFIEVKSTEAMKNDLKFNIIAHTLNKLAAVLKIQELCPTFKKMDINEIVECQKSVYDLIMTLIYRNTKDDLQNYHKTENQENEQNSEEFSNIENLIKMYEQFAIKARQLKFPKEFVSHVELVLRILIERRDVQTVHEKDIIMLKIEKNLFVLSNSTKKNIDQNVLKNQFELHTFLNEILTIRFIVYFNRIYRVLRRNNRNENHLTLIEYNQVTNAIYYSDKKENVENDESQNICKDISLLYASCYDVKLDVDDLLSNGNDETSKRIDTDKLLKSVRDKLKTKIVRVYSILEAFVAKVKNVSTIINMIIYAQKYLDYNITYFPDAAEKVSRIIYHVTNMIDKYQSIACAFPQFRDSLYGDYANDPEKLKDDLLDGKNMIGKNTKHEKPIFNNLLYETLIKDLEASTRLSVQMLWRGTLRTINDVSADVMRNVFDVSYIPKYVKLLFSWSETIVSHTLIDFADCILSNADLRKIEKSKIAALFEEKFRKKYNFREHCSALLDTVAVTFSEKSNFSDPFKVLGLKIMLEEYLQQNDSKIEVTTNLDPNLSHYVKKLNVLFDKLKNIWILNDSYIITASKTTEKKNDTVNNGVNKDVTVSIEINKDATVGTEGKKDITVGTEVNIDINDVDKKKNKVKKWSEKIKFWK